MVKSDEARKLHYHAKILEKRWLSNNTFELYLHKPPGFIYIAGQKILCGLENQQREYSLASGPEDEHLILCIRVIKDGSMSALLSHCTIGDTLAISDAYGFLLHRSGNSVLIATGTGIAPFAGYYRSGVRDALILHGVRNTDELYYRDLFLTMGGRYMPCLTHENKEKVRKYEGFNGRVTRYLETEMPKGTYTFYLCGNGKMIRDAMQIIDVKFPGSRIFTELFF